jgi:hypothetical protein
MIEYYWNYYRLMVSEQFNGLKNYIELGMNLIFFHILLNFFIKIIFNLWDVIKVQVKYWYILDLVLFPKSDFLVFIVRAQSFEALFGRAMMWCRMKAIFISFPAIETYLKRQKLVYKERWMKSIAKRVLCSYFELNFLKPSFLKGWLVCTTVTMSIQPTILITL